MKTFLEDLPGLAPAAPGHRPADIALVRHVGGKADPVPPVKDRRQHRHVRRMGASPQIRMVGDEGIPLVHLGGRISL